MKHSHHETHASAPSENAIREYAHHLYEARGSVEGHEESDWLEAEKHLRTQQHNKHNGETQARHQEQRAVLASHNLGEI